MKKIFFFTLLFAVLLSINVFAFPELEDAKWAKNYESSITIRNTETASFFYTISSSNVPVSVSIYIVNDNYLPLSHILTQIITKEDFEKQGYIYSNGELKLGYTSSLITINPNDYGLTEGNYKIQIEIKDEKHYERNSVLALELIVTKETSNKAPTAVIDVSPSKTVKIDTPVTFSGLRSYDEDGSIAEYDWAQLSGYEAFEFDEKASELIVTPTKEGYFSFVLKVKDNEGLESSLVLEEVKVVKEDISEENNAPVADAGLDLFAKVGSIVTLDGSLSSDPEGDMITHLWKQINGENVVLSGITTATPSFLASKVGEYEFELTVMDSNGKSSSDQVKVTVIDSENKNPVALFNIPPEAIKGSTVQLDASPSYDEDGEIVEYKWETDDNTFFGKVASYVFTVAKEFIVKLTVTDDKGATSTVEKVINIKDLDTEENLAPIANAGPDQSVSINSVVTLDGSLSYDPNEDEISYSWTQIEGSLVSLEDSATKNPRFTARIAGEYKFSLVVIDDKGASSLPDEVVITVLEDDQIEENLVPIANAGPDQSVSINSVVTLDGSLSYDPNEDEISYSWTQIEGSLVSLEDSATKNPRFTARIAGEYKFSLVVIDDKGASSLPDEVVITVLEDGQIPPPEKEIISRDLHKFTITSAFVQENDDRLDVYAKVRNRGDNREGVILSATILPTGEYASTRTIAEINENSYEILPLNKPQESGSYIIKIDVSNRRDRDVYYLQIEV